MRRPRLRALAAAGVVLLLATLAVAFTPLGLGIRSRLAGLLSHPAELIDPGPLSRHHAAVPELSSCQACHDLTGEPPDDKCIACHEDVARRRETGGGWHASFGATCASCHPDHRPGELADFDHGEFNHARARFRLLGAHLDLDCTECHLAEAKAGGERLTWHGIAHANCSDCHADPHAPSLGVDCSRCHDEKGWGGRALHFAHARDTAFPLTGGHAKLACDACHRPVDVEGSLASAPLRGTPAACAACHEDPHAGALDDDCARCHGESGWTGPELRFRHDRDSRFRLEGPHADLECTACHQPPVAGGTLATAPLRGRPEACAGCHTDAHTPTLGEDCSRCHVQASWTGRALVFRHDSDTQFALDGAHRTVACAACHRPATPDATLASAPLAGTPTACADCHSDPHAGQFEQGCATCHTSAGWTGRDLVLDHAAFPLRGRHAAVVCAGCHEPRGVTPEGGPAALASARFAELPGDCASCHEDPHEGRLAPKGCAECHDERDWAARAFDHQRDAALGLDATHARLDCAQCHDETRFRPEPTDCASCHDRVAKDLAGSVDLPPDAHAESVGCADCHDTTAAQRDTVTKMARRCVKCHAPAYAQLHVERTRRVDELALEILSREPVDPELRAELDRLRRLSPHNYVPAEASLRRLAQSR